MKIEKDSLYWCEPSNHRYIPGYSGYGKYLWVREHIPVQAKVLDVGCNCGQFLQNLVKELEVRAYGVDLNDEYIAYCRGNKPGMFKVVDWSQSIRTVRRHVRDWPRHFDVVTCLEVIEHGLPGTRENLAKNVVEFVAPGGVLIVTTPLPGKGLGVEIREHEAEFSKEEVVGMFSKHKVVLEDYGTMKVSNVPERGIDTHAFVFRKSELNPKMEGSDAIGKAQQAWVVNHCKEGLSLQVGCGEKPIRGVVNVDLDPGKRKWADVIADTSHLSFVDEVFDNVVSNHVLQGVVDLDSALAEQMRVLKSEGIMAHVIPDHMYAPKRLDKGRVYDYCHHAFDGPDSAWSYLRRLAQRFEFQLVELVSFPFLFSFKMVLRKVGPYAEGS